MAARQITWKRCTDLPIIMSSGQSTVIGDKVYFGGGDVDDILDWGEQFEYLVYCYNLSQDKWTKLPPMANRWFSLCQINGRLTAIGGRRKGNLECRENEVYSFDESSQRWEKVFPPMPTAKSTMPAVSLPSAAIAIIGGGTKSGDTNTVEIFRPDTLQWYKTGCIQKACCAISAVSIGNTCYALGGYNDPQRLNQAFCASVDDLLSNAVPVDMPATTTNDIWKNLPNTPTYQPVAAVLNNNLYTIGGLDRVDGHVAQKAIYMYNVASNQWIYADELPNPLVGTSVAMLSTTEILVIGGWNGDRVKTVYKGTASQ